MMRIGQSRDTHRLRKGTALTLGGVSIPSPYEAVGHSDADCLLHAVSESILGALALGDIGTHFPDDDVAYENVDSKELLMRVANLMWEKGFQVVNMDATVHLETPKLKDYIDPMRTTIANCLGTKVAQVSLKATTGEKVGPVGKSEAISAECVVLLEQRRRIQPL